jgi:PKD repeat protein
VIFFKEVILLNGTMSKAMKQTVISRRIAFLAIVLLCAQSSGADAMQVNWSSADNTELALDGGTVGLPVGSLVALGTFGTMTDSQIAPLGANPTAVWAAFSSWDTTTIDEDHIFLAAGFAPGTGFYNKQAYLVAFDAPTASSATQVGVFKGPSVGDAHGDAWIFPAIDGDTVPSIDTASVSSNGVIIGSYGVLSYFNPAYGDWVNALALAAVPGVPVASFSALPRHGSPPMVVTFTDSSTGTITNRFWDFGDGATSNTTATIVDHTYNALSTNTITLVVSGPLGISTLTRTNYVFVDLCSFAVSPNSDSFDYSGGNGNLSVTVTSTCPWSATSDVAWITITAGDSGVGSGSVSYSVAPNPSSMTRTGTIAIADQTCTVSQTGNGLPQITSAPAVTNAIVQAGDVVAVVAGQPLAFTVTSMDPDGDPLSCFWDFGDGSFSSDCEPTHVFTNCGPQAVSVTISDGLASTTTNLDVAVACLLTVTKLRARADFAKTNADSCIIKGTLDLPYDYSFAGKLMTLDVAGAGASVTLDSKGRGHNNSIMFRRQGYNRQTNQWAFTAKLLRGTWHSSWDGYGMINSNIPKPGVSVTLPALVVIDNEAFIAEQPLTYTARAGSSGIAR